MGDASGEDSVTGNHNVALALSSSKHYPPYSLNVASMWLKLGRLYMGLEKKSAGIKALKKVPAAFSWTYPSGVVVTSLLRLVYHASRLVRGAHFLINLKHVLVVECQKSISMFAMSRPRFAP